MPTARTLGLGLIVLGMGIGALVPIFLVVYPAAGIGPTDATNPAVVLPVIAANPALIRVPGAIEIVAHAIGAVALIGLWARYGTSSFLLAAATLGGIVWLGVDMVDNAITYHLAPSQAAEYVTGSAAAGPAFVQLMRLTEAIRLGAHVAGGLWMVGLSTFAIRTGLFAPAVGWLGIAVGAVFAANLFVPVLLNISFMTVPVWLVALGAVVARTQTATASDPLPRMAEA
jgi:hypothetical protein